MASRIELGIETLKMSLDRQNPDETLRQVQQIVQQFEDTELTGPEKDLGISKVFDARQGLLTFLVRSMKCNKMHKQANVRVLELFEKIITEQADKTSRYSASVVEVMLKFILSSSVSAMEKERATVVMQALVTHNLCKEIDMNDVLVRLLQVFDIKKATGRFLQHINELLGMCARDYPDCVAGQVLAMRNMFLDKLEKTLLTQNDVSYPALTGAFVGLNHFLVNFAPGINDEPLVCGRIYTCVKKLSDPPEDVYMIQLFRASLDLFATHSNIMAKQIFADHQYWHNTLTKWLYRFTTRELRKTAFQAMHSFHKTIADSCSVIPNDSTAAIEGRISTILQFYINHFKTILLASASQPFEVRIAIRGFGLMASACHKRLPPSNLTDLLTLVMQRTESTCRDQMMAQRRDAIEHYPDFVRALSQIMQHVPHLSNVQINSMQTIIVSLIRDFCYLSPSYHPTAVASLMHTFANLAHLGTGLLDILLERCTMQGVIWTCSHKLVLDSNDDWATMSDWKDHITFETFMPLWLGITKDDLYESSEENRPIKLRVYRHLLDSLFIILDRLDLTTKARRPVPDEDLTLSGDPNRDLEPVNSADFHLFFNIVQMYERLLTNLSDDTHRAVFNGYARNFFSFMAQKFEKYPLVSGFVRLITVALKICGRLQMFETQPEALVRFVQSQIIRAQRTQGELQFACLECVFASPRELLVQFCNELGPVYRIAFELGRSELRIAKIALKSLGRLTKAISNSSEEISRDDLQRLLREILPTLDVYLQAQGVVSELGDMPTATSTQKKTKPCRKRVLRLNDSGKDSELVVFQKDILMFLGTLEPHTCLHMIDEQTNSSNGNRSLTKPDADQTLRLTLHFGELQPQIYLDTFVPRICAIATGAPERQTKMAACELAHSIVLYVVGTRNYGAGSVWRMLCSAMLQLGCDGDVAVRQMFEPLLMQLMHYMSHRSQMLTDGVTIMFDCLIEGVSHPSSAGIRDMSARCLREYVEWNTRQNHQSDQLRVTIVDLLKRLKLSSFDSAPHRRVGAAVAFNHLHQIVREEDVLVDAVWLDLLYTFAVNFLMSEQFGASTTDLNQSSAALKNVARVLQERSNVFNTPNETRLVPPAFNGSVLKGAIQWLFEQCAAPQLQYRRKCIALVHQLAPHVDRCGSVKAFMNNTQTVDTVLAVCERSQELELDLNYLLVSLDCYVWLIGDDLVPNSKEVLRRSNIIPSIVALLNATNKSDHSVVVYTECLTRIVDFLFKILPTYSDIVAQAGFWDSTSESLIALLFQCVFSPHELKMDVYSKRALEFIEAHRKLCPASFSKVFDQRLKAELQSRYDEVVETAEMYLHSTIVPVILTDSARGIVALLQRGLPIQTGDKLIEDLFDGLSEKRIGEDYAHFLLPDVRRYARTLLHICLHTKPTKQLIKLALNTNHLSQMDIRSTILHGQHFLQVFQTTIFEYLLTCPEDTIAELIIHMSQQNIVFIEDLCRNLSQFAYKKHPHNRVLLKQIVCSLCEVIPKMMIIYGASEKPTRECIAFAVIDLVTHIALISPDPLITLATRIDCLEKFIIDVLSEKDNSLEIKSRCVFLLPCLVDASDETHTKIDKVLQTVQEHHFPLLSNEFPEGSLERSAFASLFQSLLDALIASKSPTILRFVIQTTAADSKHILEFAIAEALVSYVRSSTTQRCLDMPFEMYLDQSLEPNIRLNVLKRFLLPMLRASSIDSVFTFFSSHLNVILDLAATNYGIAASGWSVEHALVSRIGAFKMIEALVGIVPVERLQTDKDLLRTLKDAPKSTIGLLTAKTMATRADIFVTDDPVASELFRAYQCATFSTICSIISNTQTDLQYYEKLLFKENPAKNEVIWQKIIDCRDQGRYTRNLSQEFEEVPRRKERLVSIRGVGLQETRTDRVFMQTQNVFDSSLSQDVAKIDLSTCTVRSESEVAAQMATRHVVELERVPINDHEVMATLCAVIQHMFENNITPTDPNGGRNRVAPSWAKHLCKIIEDSSQPRNVRYFLAKVIDNCRSYFKHYATTMTGALLTFLADECVAQIDGDPINFFVLDLAVTLLEWHDLYSIRTADEIRSARTLLKFLMQNAWHARKDAFKQRLEIIRNLVHIWKDLVPLPRQELIDAITRTTRSDSRDNLCGIQLNAIVLCCNQIPWTETATDAYFGAVLVSLDNDYTNIYQPASYLLGMVLNRLVPADQLNDNQYVIVVHNKLKKLRAARKDEKRFLDILYGVHKNFPSIVSEFLITVQSFIPTSSGAIKRMYLEMLLASMDTYGKDVFRELLSVGLINLLRSDDFQLIALHCVNKALPHMTPAHVRVIVNDISTLIRSRQTESRRFAVEIFVYILMHSEDGGLRDLAIVNLLTALTDAEPTIKARVFQFWTNSNQLPLSVDGRLLGILDLLYEPRVEEHFLAYGTQLLLDPAIQSAEAKRPVFPHQPVEDDTKLTEYDIDVSWCGRNSSMRAPLFMHSQQQHLNEASQLKATQNRKGFEPTQDPADTLSIAADSQFATLSSQTSLLFSVAPQLLDRRSQRVGQVDGTTEFVSSSFGMLRERFLKEKVNAVSGESRKWVDIYRSKEIKKQTIKSNRKVQLFRRYRHGDYPDLLINNLALLLPLQALAEHDKHLAGQLFVSIYSAVVVELGAVSKPFLISTADYMQRIFRRTKHCDPVVFSTLMEMALVNPKHFDLPADLVGSLAIANQNLALAICYLERRLYIDWDTDGAPTTIRSNDASSIQVDQQHWLKLTELYRALAESDVVAGIFADKLDVVGKIPAAISLEINGDLEGAQRLYREVIERGKILEQDFAYQSYFDLFERLGDWSALATCCATQVDQPEQYWADDWAMDTLLPNMMRATSRLVLSGNEKGREFMQTIEQWVRTEQKAEHMNLHFGEELMMLHMASGQHNHARVYGDRKLVAFLSEWSNLAVVSGKVRAAKLLSIRTVAEMHGCAQMLVDRSASDSSASWNRNVIESMAKCWKATRPRLSDSTRLWDAIVSYRGCVAKSVASDDGGVALMDAVVATKFRMLEVALLQGNVSFANRIVENVPDQRNALPWIVARCQHQTIKAYLGRGNRTVGAQVKLHLKAWDGLLGVLRDEEHLTRNQDIQCRALDELSCIGERLLELVPKIQPQDANWETEIRQRAADGNSTDLEVQLYAFSLKCLQKRVELIQNTSVSLQNDVWFEGQSAGDVYFRLASYCQKSQSNDHLMDKIKNSDRIIIDSMLRAMHHGSQLARQMFPRLLGISALKSDVELQHVFNSQTDAVPEWMFLGWIPQILSMLSFENASFVDALLLRIAKIYPLAIAYPFRLSYEHFLQNVEVVRPVSRPVVQELVELLNNPTNDSFVGAMQSLCIPEKKLAYHLRDFFWERSGHVNEDKFKHRLRLMIENVWPAGHETQNGRAYDRIEKYRKLIAKLEQSGSVANKEQVIRDIITALDESIKSNAHENDTLRTISPWLSRFQWCGKDTSYLELPGQYTGDRRPDVAKHVHIVKFGDHVDIFETLRHPIRVRMHGSDGRTYSFLVKYGEDLRQDQRVEQMLALMSAQLSDDAHCRAHSLRLDTYAVIPLSVHCGMLGWMNDSPPILNIVEKSMERRKLPVSQLKEYGRRHTNFIRKASGTTVEPSMKSHLHFYGKAAIHYSRIQIINSFHEIEYSLPAELIRSALYDMAATPQSFFALRTNFATSLAALSVAHWLLGIGDRHLSNVLLNVKTGRVVGIDFGLTFGAGTRDQNVPELIPFRLTPQFVTVMSPLGLTGIITKGMGHALRCFREGRTLLQSCMEVFVREPSINWLTFARSRVLAENASGESTVEEHWEPAHRISMAQRKLCGANPRAIMCDELLSGKIASYPEYLAAYARLVTGDAQHNIRSRLPDDGLSAEDQVRCLLDMATDPALLGSCWSGIQSWI